MLVQNQIFGLLDKIQNEMQAEDVLKALKGISDDFGFQGFILCGLPQAGDDLEEMVLLQGWSQDWVSRYLEQSFIDHDPVAAQVRGATLPFQWSDVGGPEKKLCRGARQVMDEAASIGMPDGFCVPIYRPDGFQASLSFGGEGVDLSPDEKYMLHLVGIYAHNRMQDLCKPERAERKIKLTPRECECLKWASDGKTSWEISQILAISHYTADWYLASASKKLQAVNRTQAVAEALRQGFIV